MRHYFHQRYEMCKLEIEGDKTREHELSHIITYSIAENQDETKGNLVNIVELLLESFRQYKRMEFKPNKRALRSLVEMGFKEKDAIGALKVTGNDQSNAVSYDD